MASQSSGSGIGFTGALTIVFIVLKLVHVIDWSWWWVLSPLWICVGLFMGAFAIVGIVFIVCAGVIWLMELGE